MRCSPKTTLFGLLAFAFCLRIVWIDTQTFSMDEVAELTIAKLPLDELVWYADSMPPGYSLLLKGVFSIFSHDLAARWLSALLGTASVVCVWGVGRELVDERTAVAAGLAIVVLPMHLFYSQYVRGYIVLFLLVALATWYLLRALKSEQPKDWVGFVISSVCGAYVHYYFVIFLATSLILVTIERRNLWIGRNACLAFAMVGVLSLPLLGILPADFHFQQHLRAPQTLGIASYVYTYFSFFTGYSLGPSRGELHTLPTVEAARLAAPWAILLGVFVATIGYAGLQELRRHRRAVFVITFLCLPPLLIGILGYALGLNYHVRFVVWCMIPLAVLLGAGIAAQWHTVRMRLALTGWLVICAVAVGNRNYVPRYQHEDLRTTAAYLKSHRLDSERIFVLSDYLTDTLKYYGEPDWQIVRLPRSEEVSVQILSDAELQEALSTISAHAGKKGNYWLVYSRPFHGDPHGLLLDRLSQSENFSRAKSFAGVELYHYQEN
ncbi:MAG: glycosyltransferase family 39 protein [Pirellulales bacterium]|nr:glycosyltransferase family 39 protein [Pirellulales bacterium]